MEITASMVKELRERSGAGMMECKKALTENNGDIDAAIEWLRKQGLAKADKKASRIAAEGLVGVAAAGTRGALMEVNAETDFVGRNEQFQKFVATSTKIALENAGDLAKVAATPYPGTGRDVQGELTNLIATIGENMSLRRSASLSVSDGVVVAYTHNSVAPDLGKIGVLVALESTGDKAKLAALSAKLLWQPNVFETSGRPGAGTSLDIGRRIVEWSARIQGATEPAEQHGEHSEHGDDLDRTGLMGPDESRQRGD